MHNENDWYLNVTQLPTSPIDLVMGEFWKSVCEVFPILLGKTTASTLEEGDILHIVDLVHKHNVEKHVCALVWAEIKNHLAHHIIPEFWSQLSVASATEREGFNRFHKAMGFLYKSLKIFEPTLKIMKHFQSDKMEEDYLTILHSVMVAKMNKAHHIIMHQYFSLSFKVFCNMAKSNEDMDESAENSVSCSGCGFEVDQCTCADITKAFKEVNVQLIDLDLMERLVGDRLRDLIYIHIATHVQESCKGSFDISHLEALEKWLESVVMAWLAQVYGDLPNSQGSFNHCKSKLTQFLYETYTRTRVEQLFTIIIEFPDSQPALKDLRLCLQKTNLRGYLTQKLQYALETRLLHPGVNTTDILIAYIAAIRALRLLDPSGVLLDTVTAPVRHYLRQREDTVRCVVTSLTEEGPSELAEELARGSAMVEIADSDDEMDDWQSWCPPPVDADPAQASKCRRSSDIISMLVNVYGSKELFVSEYRVLLADRLLSQFNYNTEKEIRYLELLKLRFGDSQLHYCEVMLKDVHDSRRMNAHLHSDPNFNMSDKDFPCTAIILSAQFWPPFKDETLEVPPFVKKHLENYTKAFETLKGNRTLNWKPHLGYVNLDVEIKHKKVNLTVSPIHATIIWHFQNQSQWTIEHLSQAMHVPASLLRRKIPFWQTQGLIHELTPDVYVLIDEDLAAQGYVPIKTVDHVACEDEETESALASAHEQREGELQVFWSYIVGMLTNLDSLPLERIHQMLKMFASQGPSSVECSQQELRHFLDRKVREHQLLLSGGLYKLPKS